MPRTFRRPAEAGFTLIELLLALIVAAEVIVAAAMAFDFSNQAAAVQTQVTDMQQSLRVVQHDIARLVRMAGRGGLPAGIRPDLEFDPSETIPDLLGMALEVRNGVTGTGAQDRRVARGVADSPVALEGTDILTVRGCFTNPLYQLESETLTLDDPAAPTAATMVIRSESVIGIQQPLAPLCEELDAAGGGTLLLASPEGREVYGLGLITQDDCGDSVAELNLELDLTFNSPLNPDQSDDPTVRDRRFPPRMEAITACLLEEYRYFVQELHENPLDPTSPLRPRLARARFEPGTELPYGGDVQNYALPLADGIIDLQIALGFDTGYPRAEAETDTPGAIDDDTDFLNDNNDEVIYEAPVFANRNLDDWLYNHPDDVNNEGKALSPRWRVHDFTGRAGLAVQLYQVRVTTIARTNRADRTYQAPDFDPIIGQDYVEDHDYDTAPASAFKTVENRKFRRRALTTIIDLRNL